MSGSCNSSSSIATNAANIKNLQLEVEKLEVKSDNSKDDIVNLATSLQLESATRKLDQEKVLHAVEESNTAIANLASSIEQIAEDQKEMKTDIHHLKNNSFNLGKFFSGCMSPKGFIIIMTVCTTISVVSLSVFAPDSVSDYFKTVQKTSK